MDAVGETELVKVYVVMIKLLLQQQILTCSIPKIDIV